MHGERGRVRIGQPAFGEAQALAILQAVGQHAGQQVRLGLGGMLGNSKRKRLVDVAIQVAQVDLEAVYGCVERHPLKLPVKGCTLRLIFRNGNAPPSLRRRPRWPARTCGPASTWSRSTSRPG